MLSCSKLLQYSQSTKQQNHETTKQQNHLTHDRVGTEGLIFLICEVGCFYFLLIHILNGREIIGISFVARIEIGRNIECLILAVRQHSVSIDLLDEVSVDR